MTPRNHQEKLLARFKLRIGRIIEGCEMAYGHQDNWPFLRNFLLDQLNLLRREVLLAESESSKTKTEDYYGK